MTVIFKNWISFVLLSKESIPPIFDTKYRYQVSFECHKTQLSPFIVGNRD